MPRAAVTVARRMPGLPGRLPKQHDAVRFTGTASGARSRRRCVRRRRVVLRVSSAGSGLPLSNDARRRVHLRR